MLDKMDIKSFKELLKAYNAGLLRLPEVTSEVKEDPMAYHEDDPALTRDLSYYEENAMAEVIR